MLLTELPSGGISLPPPPKGRDGPVQGSHGPARARANGGFDPHRQPLLVPFPSKSAHRPIARAWAIKAQRTAPWQNPCGKLRALALPPRCSIKAAFQREAGEHSVQPEMELCTRSALSGCMPRSRTRVAEPQPGREGSPLGRVACERVYISAGVHLSRALGVLRARRLGRQSSFRTPTLEQTP